jgi:hypothetical protein
MGTQKIETGQTGPPGLESPAVLPGAPGLAFETWETAVLGTPPSPRRNNGPETRVPRPLPVDCWDWTETFALQANARAMAENPPPGLIWGWGARASGLSHLT